jgi:HSP20 family molecular chaperone IbpA
MKTSTPAVKAIEASLPAQVQLKNQEAVNLLNEEISRRAYELFEQGGRADGQDRLHWLRAEEQTLRPIPEIRESSSWYTVNVPVTGFDKEDISVGVEPHRGVIVADKTRHADGNAAADSGSFRNSFFLVATWPSEVDPATASAYIKNESLTLTVKRSTLTTK